MHDHVTVVVEHPARVRRAFLMKRAQAALFQGLLYLVPDRLQLAVAFTGTDDEIARKRADITDIEQRNVRSLFLARRFNRPAGYLERFQKRDSFQVLTP